MYLSDKLLAQELTTLPGDVRKTTVLLELDALGISERLLVLLSAGKEAGDGDGGKGELALNITTVTLVHADGDGASVDDLNNPVE